MTNKFSVPRGTSDILPSQVQIWQHLEANVRRILDLYNYKEIRTPIFEDTELFARSMGQTSDVVQKQMLNLASQKESQELSGLSLRPENTASVVRSYIQNGLDKKENISKLFYIGAMFRGERPQKGRLRQFHQIGVEAIGPNSATPYLDAEIISLAVKMLKNLGLKNFKLRINTLGTPQDKENFSKVLRKKLEGFIGRLPQEIKSRYIQNIFRILDSKDKDCQKAVADLDIDHSYLSKESLEYYENVKKALKTLSVEYIEDFRLVRGLDYYTHTVFEISDSSLGAQDALGAGGRYNGLVHQLGGNNDIDAMGFALGMERILLALGDHAKYEKQFVQAVIIAVDEESVEKAFGLLNVLRSEGVSSEMGFKASSMKSQMRQANKLNAKFAVIIGEKELQESKATVKNMETSEQEEVSFGKIAEYINSKN